MYGSEKYCLKCSVGFQHFLQGNKLQEITGDILQGAVNLTELNAGRRIAAKNKITELPDEVGCLSHLIRLNLHQNGESQYY
jgi:hypothetical protein